MPVAHRRRLRLLAVLAGSLGVLLAVAGTASARTGRWHDDGAGARRGEVRTAAPAASDVTVSVRPHRGDVAAARAAVRRAGGRLTRGATPGTFEAVVPAGATPALAADPAVGTVQPAVAAGSDELFSQGVEQTGATSIMQAAGSGLGMRVAILDLGFLHYETRLGTELPAAPELQSFDAAHGITGADLYGAGTSHGERVAEVVHDFVPAAQLLLVNYHTLGEFDAAVAWLQTQNVQVIVHAGSFLGSPDDGTGVAAAAVDRAAAQGILWVNSAGNFATRHYAAAYVDGDGDGYHDFPGSEVPGALVLHRAAGDHVSLSLDWNDWAASGATTDYDLELWRVEGDGSRTEVAASAHDQDGAPDDGTADTPVEAIGAARNDAVVSDVIAPTDTTYLVRVKWRGASGNPAAAPPAPGTVGSRLDVFSREGDFGTLTVPASSIVTPGDARGALTIGAIDTRTGLPEDYSSRGPTLDGRAKPDLVAQTNVLTGNGTGFTGTSGATSTAGGAAALAWAQDAIAGHNPNRDTIAARLHATAGIVAPAPGGAPWPADLVGAGRLRLDLTPPVLGRLVVTPNVQYTRTAVRITGTATDDGTLKFLSVLVNGVQAAIVGRTGGIGYRWLPRADGTYSLAVRAEDFAGNLRTATRTITVDRVAPRVGFAAAPRRVAHGRQLELRVAVADRGTPKVNLRIELHKPKVARAIATKRITVTAISTTRLRLALPKVAIPTCRKCTIVVYATDLAGNAASRRTNLTSKTAPIKLPPPVVPAPTPVVPVPTPTPDPTPPGTTQPESARRR